MSPKNSDDRTRINMWVKTDLIDEAKKIANEKGMSLTDFVSMALSTQIAEEKVTLHMPEMLNVMNSYMDLLRSGVIDLNGEVKKGADT